MNAPSRGVAAARKPRVCGHVTMLYLRELLATAELIASEGEVDNERPVQSARPAGKKEFERSLPRSDFYITVSSTE